MIELVPMTESDFAKFCAYTLKTYADDKLESGEWLPEEAQQNALNGFQKLLPEGMATSNHFFYCLVDSELTQCVGYIWFQVRGQGAGRDAFIMDHVIREEYRNRGYGAQTHQAMNAKLLAMNIKKVSMHVAAQNTGSLRFLERLGYRVTGIDLSKQLRKDEGGF